MDHNQALDIVCGTLFQKYPTQNIAGGVAQVVECLPSKHKARSSNLSTAKKKKNKVKNMQKLSGCKMLVISQKFSL
jgi:hypothetical protein